MKKVIGIALVLLLGCSMMAFADASAWLLNVTATDQNFSNGTQTMIGWASGFTNGADADFGEPMDANGAPPATDLATVVSWIGSSASVMDFRQPLAEGGQLPMDFYLSTYYQRAGTPTAPISVINVTLDQSTDFGFDYAYDGGLQIRLQYKDATGALQENIFDAKNPLTSFTWQTVAKTEFDAQNWDAKLRVEKVPEPGSMLALGSGLVGLMGFALRRRS